MRLAFWEVVWSSFKKMYGGLTGTIGILIAVILYIFAFPENQNLRVMAVALVVITTMLLVLTLTFFDAAFTLYKRGSNLLPRVRLGREPFQGTSAALVCLLDPSDLFSHGIWVSLYRIAEEGIEVPIGTGAVANIQENGNILIEVTQVLEGEEDFAQSLQENKADALNATRVKPHVPRQMFGL